jgi:hypothetical protein
VQEALPLKVVPKATMKKTMQREMLASSPQQVGRNSRARAIGGFVAAFVLVPPPPPKTIPQQRLLDTSPHRMLLRRVRLHATMLLLDKEALRGVRSFPQ